MSDRGSHHEAQSLVVRATSDLRAAKRLAADPDQEDDVGGFHAQQAVEKVLKAALHAAGAEPPRTHDLTFLLELAADQELRLPELVRECDWLTPWAVAARYGIAHGALDRSLALEAAAEAVEWAQTELGVR